MDFTITYIADSSSWFRYECDYSFTEEDQDRDVALRAVLTKIVSGGWSLSDLTISTFKSVMLETPRGLELFKSEPITVENYSPDQIEAMPIYLELKAARDKARVADEAVQKLADKERCRAERIRIYNEVKAEFNQYPDHVAGHTKL